MTFKKLSASHGKNTKPMCNKPFWRDITTGRIFDKKSDVPLNSNTVEHWDSILEFQCYQALLEIVPAKSIERQKSILILPPKPPFPAWNWNVDFVIDGFFLVEAKGQWLLKDEGRKKSFLHTLRILQEVNPDRFKYLTLVDRTAWSITGTKLQVIAMKDLKYTLQAKMRLAS